MRSFTQPAQCASAAFSAVVARQVKLLRATKTELSWLLEAIGANAIAEMSSSQAVHAMSRLQRERALRDRSPGL